MRADAGALRSVVLAVAVVLLGLRWAWPLVEGWAPGLASGEGAAHIWGLLTTSQGLWEHGPFVRVSGAAHPEGVRRDLLDPVNLLVFGPLWGLTGRAALAWAGLGLAWIAVAAASGWALGRRLGGPGAALVLGLAWAASPYLHGGLLPVGRSEYWPWALWPLHLALLHDALHAESPARRWRRAGAAGLVLGLLAHGGWQPLLFLLLGQVPAALLLARGARRPAPVLVAVGALGALLSVPMLEAHLGVDPWWLRRLDGGTGAGEPLATPASSLLGVGGMTGGDAAPFAGWLLPVLALGAAVRSREARPWALLGAGLLVLALGPRCTLGGLTLFAPFALLPGSDALHGPARLAGLAALPLGISIVTLFAVGSVQRSRWRWALLLGLLVEGLLWRPRQERPGIPVSPPRSLRALLAPLPAGPVAVFWAAATPRETERDHLLLQLAQEGRVSSVGPSPQVARPLSPYSVVELGLPRQSPLDHPCAAEEGARLWAAGFRSVLLVYGREGAQGRRHRRERELTALHGAPAARAATGVSWQLTATPPPAVCGERLDVDGAI